VAGQAHGSGATEIYRACLPAGEPLAPSRWKVIRNSAGDLEPIAGRSLSVRWDGKGGRHCPSYVRGWDPEKNVWVVEAADHFINLPNALGPGDYLWKRPGIQDGPNS
jgi:hypothetical protein